MFSKETLEQVTAPSLVLLIVTILCTLITEPNFELGPFIVFLFIAELLALLTGYSAVIVRGRARKHLWINYFIWIVLFNLGRVAMYFGW